MIVVPAASKQPMDEHGNDRHNGEESVHSTRESTEPERSIIIPIGERAERTLRIDGIIGRQLAEERMSARDAKSQAGCAAERLRVC
jgi:hypothetical protein